MRLIDANRMKEHVALQKDILVNMGMEEIGNTLTKMVFDEINIQPTVDAVPVVRCKDCIEYRDCVGACHYFNYEPTDEMDFCSHGIRADGERRSNEA